jgi:hypothetical protein
MIWYIYIYTCMYACFYVCIYTYTHMHRRLNHLYTYARLGATCTWIQICTYILTPTYIGNQRASRPRWPRPFGPPMHYRYACICVFMHGSKHVACEHAWMYTRMQCSSVVFIDGACFGLFCKSSRVFARIEQPIWPFPPFVCIYSPCMHSLVSIRVHGCAYIVISKHMCRNISYHNTIHSQMIDAKVRESMFARASHQIPVPTDMTIFVQVTLFKSS